MQLNRLLNQYSDHLCIRLKLLQKLLNLVNFIRVGDIAHLGIQEIKSHFILYFLVKFGQRCLYDVNLGSNIVNSRNLTDQDLVLISDLQLLVIYVVHTLVSLSQILLRSQL
jgi:hypothetical protein